MTGSEVPRGVRVAAALAWLMVPAGALLAAAGVLDLLWWASPDARQLTAMMQDIETEYGIPPPSLVRAGGGAIALVLLGAAGMAYAGLAPLIHRGVRWARAWALSGGSVIFLIGLLTIGSDASRPSYLRDFYASLTWTTIGDRIPRIQAMLYPGWYPWFEDAAQGLAAAVALAVVVSLVAVVISHPDHFRSRGERGEPDEWDAAISRIRAAQRPQDRG
ncbi:hypothetical protein [Actinoplanes solisilvae]|uniref:hypothetical protein n=1 Tax=Actinoplanes solisilvae TaxID=2486853 RepID=UPI000FD7FA34|nr:hypothetical protein [Actinoplanes solisilvae]